MVNDVVDKSIDKKKKKYSISVLLEVFFERLFSGFSWNVLSAVMLQGSVLLSTLIVARLLGLHSFGIFSLLVATVMTTSAIAQGGTGLVATKYVAEFLACEPQRVGRILKLCRIFTLVSGGLSSVVMFFGAEIFCTEILGRGELTQNMRLVASATFFQASVAYQIGALQGFGSFKALGRAGVLAGAGHMAFIVTGAWFWHLTGALLGFVLASAFRSACFAYILKSERDSKNLPIGDSLDYKDIKLFWSFAFPAWLAGLVTAFSLWFVTVLVARLPDGLSLVAILTVAHQVRLVVLQLPSLLNAVSFSVLSHLRGLKDTGAFRDVFRVNLVVNLIFTTFFVTVLILFAEQVLNIYGHQFSSGRWPLIILLVSLLPEMLAMSFYQLVQSAGRMWLSLFAIVLPRDAAYLAASAFFLPAYGITGAACAYLFTRVIEFGLTLFASHISASADTGMPPR